MPAISRENLQSLMAREQKKFVDERPKSKALFERARKSSWTSTSSASSTSMP